MLHGADRRKSEELTEEEEEEEEERRQAAVEVVGEMQLTAEQLKVTPYPHTGILLHFIFKARRCDHQVLSLM